WVVASRTSASTPRATRRPRRSSRLRRPCRRTSGCASGDGLAEAYFHGEDRGGEHERDGIPQDDRHVLLEDAEREPAGEADGEDRERGQRDVLRRARDPDLQDLRDECEGGE